MAIATHDVEDVVVNDEGAMMDLSIPNLRKECAAVLGELAVPETAQFLEKYVDDSDPDVRKNVRWALGKLAA